MACSRESVGLSSSKVSVQWPAVVPQHHRIRSLWMRLQESRKGPEPDWRLSLPEGCSLCRCVSPRSSEGCQWKSFEQPYVVSGRCGSDGDEILIGVTLGSHYASLSQ